MRKKRGFLPRPPRGCSHLRRSAITSAKTGVTHNGHHTNFPPAVCAKFAQLIVLFLSQDFRGLFTLWTDAITTCAVTLKNLTTFHQTRSSLGHPQCCQRTEDEPLHAEQFQHLFGQQFQSINFWALRSKQKDTTFVTEPHKFSRSADGGGVHSSGDWLVLWVSTDDILENLRHAVVDVISKYGLHNAASAAWAARSRSSYFLQDKHNDDILAATKSFLQSEGLQPDLSVAPNQPFRSGLPRNFLQHMDDPDIGLIDIAESGFHTGVFEPIKVSGIWRHQQIEAREDLPIKHTAQTGSQLKMIQTPCLDSSNRTSMPSS